MEGFCTIITDDYFPRAAALFESIKMFDNALSLHILIADKNTSPQIRPASERINITTIDQLASYPLVKELYKKYAHISFNNFRWSLKPIFASYLLRSGFDKIIYLDCDMFFVNDYHFLWSELDNNDIILTPHWNNTKPSLNKNGFLSNFTSGLFSAGFFGVSKKGLVALDWWANACHFMMGENIKIGVHDDQRYLDIFPILFENTKILRHRGCNIGSWNFEESKRTLVNGKVLINAKYPVIFIHFDNMIVSTILKGHDGLLKPYLDQYISTFKNLGYDLSVFIHSEEYSKAGILRKVKWKLKLRTRLKRLLYKLAESL